MLAAQRQAKIIEELRARGTVRVTDLAQTLDVSDMTIRRDLDVLAGRGMLAKVHGGATSVAPSSEEPGFAAKSGRQQDEKRAIARAAAQLVTPGASVGISAGTTTWMFANEIRGIADLTVVTNSIRVADTLHDGASGQNVILTGGVRTPSDALVGPIAVSALSQTHLDVAFLGVHGMSTSAGFTTPNMLESETNRALVAAARRLIVLADHTKWEVSGLSTIVQLEKADLVITDHRLPNEARAELESHVGEVRAAASGEDDDRFSRETVSGDI